MLGSCSVQHLRRNTAQRVRPAVVAEQTSRARNLNRETAMRIGVRGTRHDLVNQKRPQESAVLMHALYTWVREHPGRTSRTAMQHCAWERQRITTGLTCEEQALIARQHGIGKARTRSPQEEDGDPRIHVALHIHAPLNCKE